MKTLITIDPNVRVRGNSTYAGFEDVRGIPVVGQQVEVIEAESGAHGAGWIREIDKSRRLIYLDVDWTSLTLAAPEMPCEYVARAALRVSQASVAALCTVPGATLEGLMSWFQSDDTGCMRFMYSGAEPINA